MDDSSGNRRITEFWEISKVYRRDSCYQGDDDGDGNGAAGILGFLSSCGDDVEAYKGVETGGRPGEHLQSETHTHSHIVILLARFVPFVHKHI